LVRPDSTAVHTPEPQPAWSGNRPLGPRENRSAFTAFVGISVVSGTRVEKLTLNQRLSLKRLVTVAEVPSRATNVAIEVTVTPAENLRSLRARLVSVTRTLTSPGPSVTPAPRAIGNFRPPDLANHAITNRPAVGAEKVSR
jgi:hypothetical protein